MIVNIKPMWSNNISEGSADVSLRRDSRARSDRLGWTILANDPANDTANAVRAEAASRFGFVVGGLHPTDSFLRATSIRVTRLSPIFHQLDASFAAKGSEQDDNPLEEPLQILNDFAVTEEQIDEDIKGRPIVTKNGENFDPPITDMRADMVLEFRKNLGQWDYLLARKFMERGAINKDTFLGFPPGTARIRGLRAESADTKGFVYFRASMRLQFRVAAKGSIDRRAWWKRVRHEGYLFREAAGGPVKSVFKDKPELDIGKPLLLDKDGVLQLKPDGAPDEEKAHWLEFQTAPELNFATLGFF